METEVYMSAQEQLSVSRGSFSLLRMLPNSYRRDFSFSWIEVFQEGFPEDLSYDCMVIFKPDLP